MWRFVSTTENKKKFFQLTGEKSFPSRSTFFRRYKRAHALFQVAIVLQGKRAIDEGIVEPKHLAIDKSVLKARGKPYHKSDRMAGKRPKNVDFDAGWGYSKLHGWTYGYSFEVVVSSTPGSVVLPLVATANTGNAAETTTLTRQSRYYRQAQEHCQPMPDTIPISSLNKSSLVLTENLQGGNSSARRIRVTSELSKKDLIRLISKYDRVSCECNGACVSRNPSPNAFTSVVQKLWNLSIAGSNRYSPWIARGTVDWPTIKRKSWQRSSAIKR